MPTLIGSIPTTESDDVELAKRILNNKENVVGKASLLKEKLESIFQTKDIYLFNRGREALYFTLNTLGITEGDEVMVQAMTCVAVVTPILWCKAKPVYVDINKDDFNINCEDLKEKITSKTKAIIVQHTFGNIASIKRISEIAHKHNIYVIEDCAHLFYTDYCNTDIGKYSDISFFSFAQDKSISSVQGGLVIIHNVDFKNFAFDNYLNVEDQTKYQAMYNARYIRLWWYIKKYYFTLLIPFQRRITIGKVMVIFFRRLHLIKQQATRNIENEAHFNRMSDIQSTLLLNQLNKVERFNKHREMIVNTYNQNIKEELRNKSNTKCLLRYPILLSNPGVVMHQLKLNQYICGLWYNSIVFPLKTSDTEIGYTWGECPTAEMVIRNIINLPTDISVSESDAVKIADIVNQYGGAF